MIPAAFDYHRAASLADALDALRDGAAAGLEARPLAGGHSLLPLMKLRLAAPDLLVDLGRVAALRTIRRVDDELVIGAMATHREIAESDAVRQAVPLLAQVAHTVGDPQVRCRGTIGGSTAHGDPAADLPAALLATDAVMVATSSTGTRYIPAGEFFVDYFTTALAAGELLTEIRVPVTGAEQHHYHKFTAQAAGWAIVAVAIAGTRIALAGMGATPIRADAAEEALAVGGDAAAAAELADAGTSPPSDAHADADYRRHLARVLTYRALLAAQRR